MTMKSVTVLTFTCVTVLTFTCFSTFISALDNGLGRTPPMGWMSWGRFRCETNCKKYPHFCIDENLYKLGSISKAMAERLVEDGYLEAGYNFVHIDDCFMEKNRRQGKLWADGERFPSDIPSLSDYMHERGLKLGVYADYGTLTCEGYPGSLGYEKVDANRVAEWKADYLKFDGCNADVGLMEEGYHLMQKYLNATTRPIFYSCGWPLYFFVYKREVDYEKAQKYCNSWRNFHDIEMSWESILNIIDFYNENQYKFAGYHGPGAWNDPDMLIVGNWEISADQARAQMSIWAIWSAPLIMSNDLRAMPAEHKEILLNLRVIEIDQDPLGQMGLLIHSDRSKELYVYVKQMMPMIGKYHSFAIAILNRSSQKQSLEIEVGKLGLKNLLGYSIADVWSGEKIAHFLPNSTLHVKVNATGAALFKATIVDAISAPLELKQNSTLKSEVIDDI